MKLTNEIRRTIMNAAVAKSDLPKMRAKVAADLKKLGKLAYSLAVKVPKEIAALPADVRADWLQYSASISIEAVGFSHWRHCYAQGSREERNVLPASIQLDDPILIHKTFDTVKVINWPKLEAEAASVVEAHRAANDYEDQLQNKLWAILHSANTSEQLLKTWPECKKLLPPEPVKTRAVLDTKVVADVNKALNLP